MPLRKIEKFIPDFQFFSEVFCLSLLPSYHNVFFLLFMFVSNEIFQIDLLMNSTRDGIHMYVVFSKICRFLRYLKVKFWPFERVFFQVIFVYAFDFDFGFGLLGFLVFANFLHHNSR